MVKENFFKREWRIIKNAFFKKGGTGFMTPAHIDLSPSLPEEILLFLLGIICAIFWILKMPIKWFFKTIRKT